MGYAPRVFSVMLILAEVHQAILVEHDVSSTAPKAERMENIGFALGGKRLTAFA